MDMGGPVLNSSVSRLVFGILMMVANMDWAEVERAVLLQGTFYGACNDYAWRVAERYAERLLALAYVDPWRGDLEAQWEKVAGFVGVKMECSVKTGFLGLYPGARLDDPELNWFWGKLSESGKVLVLDLGLLVLAGVVCWRARV